MTTNHRSYADAIMSQRPPQEEQERQQQAMQYAHNQAKLCPQEFDDAIHQLVNAIRRPNDDASMSALQTLVKELIVHCGNDTNRWKTFVLAATYKRYHLLSPQAKQQQCPTKTNNDAGDGERLLFYTIVSTLFEHVQKQNPTNAPAKLALDCLVRIAPLAGGSRDVCTLLENMVSTLLHQGLELDSTASLSSLVGNGVRMIQQDQEQYASIQYLLQLAADTLDQDLAIVRNSNESTELLPSTLHVFLPHCNRGRKKQGVLSQRHVVNCVLEILIWSRTLQATNHKTFMECYDSFLIGGDSQIKSSLHVMQTIVRSFRKELNGFARARGYMLSDQFALQNSESPLTLEQVARGKAGDLKALTHLANKKSDERVLGLIRDRTTLLGKTTKYASVNEIVTAAAASAEQPLLQELHVSCVMATLEHLRGLVNVSDDDKSVLVASMENVKANHVTAILVAAAMSKWDVSTALEQMETEETTAADSVESVNASEPMEGAEAATVSDSSATTTTSKNKTIKLFLGGVEKEMTCFQDFLTLLNDAALGLVKNEADAPSFMGQDGIAKTKAVMNLMDRHLQDSTAMLLMTSGDLHLPSDVMKDLTARGCTLHCHDSDSIGERLMRESAQRGDITISLAWDTTDDLDLHVTIPNGEHIYYSHQKSNRCPCMLDVDMNAGGGGSKEPVENFFAGNLDKMIQAPLGNYNVVVQNYAYDSRSGSKNSRPAIPFRVIVEKNGVKEKFEGQCQGTGRASDVVMHEFNYEGRTIPFPKEEKEITAFSTSNIISVTASTGQTLESLSRLVQTVQEFEHLDAVRMLVDGDEAGGDEDEAATAERPLMAEHGTLEVTSRDRLNMLLAKLPARFHATVCEAYGGPSLVETCAIDISRRMVAERIPISELKRNGYPEDIVEAVKAQMAKTGPV